MDAYVPFANANRVPVTNGDTPMAGIGGRRRDHGRGPAHAGLILDSRRSTATQPCFAAAVRRP